LVAIYVHIYIFGTTSQKETKIVEVEVILALKPVARRQADGLAEAVELVHRPVQFQQGQVVLGQYWRHVGVWRN
jgi:hypothetical protein